MNSTEENGHNEFWKDVNRQIDDLGYEWNKSGKDIVLDLSKQNEYSIKFRATIEHHTNIMVGSYHRAPHKEKMEDLAYIDIIKKANKLSYYKMQYLFASFNSIFLIIAFLIILYHFLYFTYMPIGTFLVSLTVIVLLASVFSSLNALRFDDSELFQKKLGFTKRGNYLYSSVYNLINKVKRQKFLYIIISCIFLFLALLSFVIYNPALTYFLNVINFTALFLMNLTLIRQYFVGMAARKGGSISDANLLALFFSMIFSLIYILSYAIRYYPLIHCMMVIVDLLVLISAAYFVRDVIGIEKFLKWSRANVKLQSED